MTVQTIAPVASEKSVKQKRREAFNAKLEAIADAFVKDLAEKVTDTSYFTLDELDAQNVLYYRPHLGWDTNELRQANNWLAAGNLLDRMRHLIKEACKARGDYWYEVKMIDFNWEIEVIRGGKKRN